MRFINFVIFAETGFVINSRILSMVILDVKINATNRIQKIANINGLVPLVLSIKIFLRSFHTGGILWMRYTAKALDAM